MIEKLKGMLSSFVREKAKPTTSDEPKRYPSKPIIKAQVVKDYENRPKANEVIKNMKHKFPLEKDDVIEFRSGKKYKVCKRTITGAIMNTSVSLIWVNKPEMLRELDKIERLKYGSLRELNYYIEKEMNSIIHINKSYKNREESLFSIEECYELAEEENKKRQQIRTFFENCSNKQVGV